MIKRTVILIGVWLAASSSIAQVEVSGLADYVLKNTNEEDISNITFKGFSNFHSSRVRLFFDAAISNDDYVFTQILVDNYNMAVYAAYAQFNHLYKNYLNLHIGFIPSTVGSFAARTYSDANPLIGTPLVYNYHSSYAPGVYPTTSIDSLLATRDNRTNMGLPVMYDACWNTGLELFGTTGALDYSLGFLSGSVSKPTQEQRKDVPQVTSRLAYYFGPSLTLGLSAYYGPYLYEDFYADSLPSGKEAEDFINAGIGYDLYLVQGYFEFYSETFHCYWEHPYVPDLKVTSGYFEGKYKFYPGWYAAGRFDFFRPNELTASNGQRKNWDYPLNRYEFGLGYKPGRQVIVKLVAQLNRYDEGRHLDHDLYATQVSVMFK